MKRVLSGVMTMKKFKLLGISCMVCCIVVTGNAQINEISGKVVNTENEPLIGNAIALSVKDSSFINGISFMEGAFELKGLNIQEVVLKLTSLQFSDTLIFVKYNNQSSVDLGTIVVEEGLKLDEVQIVAQTPLFVNKPNGITEVAVANTILSKSNSVNEILSKSPNIIVSQEGISLFGKGEAIIYLNGRRITNERLASISAAQVKKIDIISNPSAKYDAEGNAVINIVTNSDVGEGLKGMVSQNITVSDFSSPSTNTALNLNYRRNKLSLVGSYGLLLGHNRDLLNTSRTRSEEEQPDYFKSIVKTDWKRDYENFSNYSVGAQFDFDENSYISSEYNGFYNKLRGTTESSNYIQSATMTGKFGSVIGEGDITYNNSVNLNYGNTRDTLGSSIFIGTQYSYYNSDTDDFIEENRLENNTLTERTLNNKVDLEIAISSTQLDYTKVFKNQSSLDVGAKFSYVENISNSEFYTSEDGSGFVLDNELTTDFEYEETVPAAYVNYKGSFRNKISYHIGLRSEITDYLLTVDVVGQQKIEDQYINLFPSASFSKKISSKMQLRVSYSSRISRPKYQSLNPSVVYQDAFTTIEGNPYLKPEKIHSFELGTSYSKYSLTLGYNYSIDPMSAAALQGDDENSYVLKAINLSEGKSYFATLSVPVDRKWWTAMNTFNVSYNELSSDDLTFKVKSSKPLLYIYSSNKFQVKDLFKMQLLGWYLGDRYDGTYYRKGRSVVSLGIEKDFFNKSLKVSVVADDIFHKNKPAGNYEVGQTLVEFDRVYNTNFYRFTVSYNFGKLKKVTYKNKSTGQSENYRAQ